MAPDDVRDVFVKGLSIWTAEEDAHLRALGGFGELTDLLQSSALLGIKGWRTKMPAQVSLDMDQAKYRAA